MKSQILSWCSVVIICVFLGACGKPMAEATIAKDIGYVSKTYNADMKKTLEALRFAFKNNGYAIATDDEPSAVITTTWVAATSDSHMIELFHRMDFGVTGAYHQLEAHATDDNGKTRVDIASRIKSVASGVKSTGIEERKVLSSVGDYLRKGEPNLTNIGIEE